MSADRYAHVCMDMGPLQVARRDPVSHSVGIQDYNGRKQYLHPCLPKPSTTGLMTNSTKFREEQTRLFLNHAFAWVTSAIFVIFVVFGGLRSEALVFSGLECKFVIYRRFRQNGPFLAGDKNKVYQKHGLCHPEKLIANRNPQFFVCNSPLFCQGVTNGVF